MSRDLAIQLSKIYKLEKDKKRPVYLAELSSNGVCSVHRAKGLIEDLLKDYSIEELSIRGSNAYTVTIIGKAHIESYIDLKREM